MIFSFQWLTLCKTNKQKKKIRNEPASEEDDNDDYDTAYKEKCLYAVLVQLSNYKNLINKLQSVDGL